MFRNSKLNLHLAAPPNSRIEAVAARRWPAGRAGLSTYKVGGRHAARNVDRAPLCGALYRDVRTRQQAARRVGFGTWALAAQLNASVGRTKITDLWR